MSIVTLNRRKLRENFNYLNRFFAEKNIEWSVVTKVLCGNDTFLYEMLSLPIGEFCDSRISNLKTIKALNPDVQTVYIKPVPLTFVDDVVKYADVSFNTEVETLSLLSSKAVSLNKFHKVVIMIEMGELREGVVREKLLDFFGKILKLPNIEIVGIGTNLCCMNGVLPDYDKMKLLHESKQEIEKTFNIRIPYISGGASVSIPLVLNDEMPPYINHFRIGETLFFGTNVYDDTFIEGMHHDVFKLNAEIIEIKEKPNIPEGKLGTNLTGEKKDFNNLKKIKNTTRAIVDIGLLDLSPKNIKPVNKNLEIVGQSSDMLVLDLQNSYKNYKVGDTVVFELNYMSLLSVMNSSYVEKKVISDVGHQIKKRKNHFVKRI